MAELATEKMRYTLELKEKQVKQTALESEADAVRREKAAEAAGNKYVICRSFDDFRKEVISYLFPKK